MAGTAVVAAVVAAVARVGPAAAGAVAVGAACVVVGAAGAAVVDVAVVEAGVVVAGFATLAKRPSPLAPGWVVVVAAVVAGAADKDGADLALPAAWKRLEAEGAAVDAGAPAGALLPRLLKRDFPSVFAGAAVGAAVEVVEVALAVGKLNPPDDGWPAGVVVGNLGVVLAWPKRLLGLDAESPDNGGAFARGFKGVLPSVPWLDGGC